ncbi:uncharacterized protein LOC114530618 [Dendronephthya gigantea]|uniref:uncharacterized protein LOC114530618 n=1 Tax=Dendronephthya gigantea TaxID=151771 RepID=UPI00106C7288|nr:uncharacterized protein LOC114530618 [Dendronephthya gigantea]
MFLPAPILAVHFLRRNWELKYAEVEKEIWYVWIIWGTYMIAYVAMVAIIFSTVAKKLTNEDELTTNALKGTLCITSALLMLLLQLAIGPSFQKFILSLAALTGLNIFDAIEMLDPYLTQIDGGKFDLNSATEVCIVFFTCLSFLLSSLSLIRNKFGENGNVKERTRITIILGFLETIGINFPFLVIRAVIWHTHQYESSVFIAKNALALAFGTVEFIMLIKVQHAKHSK